MAVGVKRVAGHRLAVAGLGAPVCRRRGKGCTHSHSVSWGESSLCYLEAVDTGVAGCDCGHMSNTKWNLPGWGLEGLAGQQKEGKEGGAPGHGDSRECRHRFFPPCLSRTAVAEDGPTPPPQSCPAPFPSRAGPGRTPSIVSRGECWRSSRWLLARASGPYKWWLVEKAPRGGSREQLCWGKGLPRPLRPTNPQMWRLRLLRLLPTSVASAATPFVSLARCSGWHRFPGWRWISGQPMSPARIPALGGQAPSHCVRVDVYVCFRNLAFCT